MWLFDDLIHKPAPTQVWAWTGAPMQGWSGQQQGSGNPQDPLQVSSTPQTPVILSQETPMINAQPQQVIIQKSSEESILTEKPIVQNRELPNVPSAVINPAHDDDGSLLVVWDDDLIVNESPENEVGNVFETPSAAPMAYVPPPEPAYVPPANNVIDPNTTSKQSLRDIQLNRMLSSEGTPTISEQDESMLSNLFWGPSEVAESTPITTPEVEETPVHEEIFENPVAFIEASIKDLDLMIEHIVETHTAKLEEAAGYKSEEEKFAGLKVWAYADGEKMMKEKAHAEKMRTYFLNQKDHALGVESGTPRESVETTLTSLSVKNSVDGATHHEWKKEASHKKATHSVKAE
jgi:hypothetical protein